jgi:acetyl esterase
LAEGAVAPVVAGREREQWHGRSPEMTEYVLEPAARRFAEEAATSPPPYELGPEKARQGLNDIQAAPVDLLDVEEQWVTVPADVGDVRVRIVRPPDVEGPLPAILYMHGGGWILGNAGTHDRLVRELAVGVGAAVAFVEYTPSPEARYPVALEQGYATARWLTTEGAAQRIDSESISVAGDSVGGNLATVLTLLAQERGDVTFVHQSLYYPVTDAGQDTESYRTFADGPFLTARTMAWFWDAYAPDREGRGDPHLSPLRASADQLRDLPPAHVVVDEQDVLRDEGEAYAARLRAAGVRVSTVRYDGIHHDFMMLNPLRETAAASAAIDQAIQVLRRS